MAVFFKKIVEILASFYVYQKLKSICLNGRQMDSHVCFCI